MQTTFDKLQTLDAIPDHALIDAYNRYVARNNPAYRLIVNEQVRPCFFSGDIEEPGKVVTISLNPAYTPGGTEAEQAGMNFRAWYDFCRLRFAHYPSDRALHTIFKNLFKVLAPPDLWSTAEKRAYLQANLLNLDWCPYYSEQFPSLALDRLPSDLQARINATWDANLRWLINVAVPRYLFIHGQAMRAWVNRNLVGLTTILHLENSRGQPCQLHQGQLTGTTLPVYYLEHFINVVNRNSTLAQLHDVIQQAQAEYQQTYVITTKT